MSPWRYFFSFPPLHAPLNSSQEMGRKIETDGNREMGLVDTTHLISDPEEGKDNNLILSFVGPI